MAIIFDEQQACAHRAPVGPNVDVFHPTRVLWFYAACPVWTLRALLTLPLPGHPDAPATLTAAPPGHGLPAKGRMPVRIRRRGQH